MRWPMPSVERFRRLLRKGPWLLGGLGLGVALYVLSTGPYLWLAERSGASAMIDFAEQIYAPLNWLAEESDVFVSFMRWYLQLWIDL